METEQEAGFRDIGVRSPRRGPASAERIGTGPMAAMCPATARRLKAAGMRRNLDDAQTMMALAALRQSHPSRRY